MALETQFSVFLINKPGILAAVTRALAEAEVNMTAMALIDFGEHGMMRMVCDNADRARQVLRDTHDRWTETDVLLVEIPNTPGSLAVVSQKLADAGVNIIYAYCTAVGGMDKAAAAFKVADTQKALDALEA